MTTQSRVDLAVPMDLRVGELLTTLVRTLGPDVADKGAAAGGLILQRTGEAPLDQSLTLRSSELRDGDVLHLRMRSARLPEVAYDDVLDAVSTGVLTKSARWSAEHTARACMVGASLCVAFVLLACLASGPSWAVPASIAGGLSLLLLGAGVALEHAYAKRGAALTAAAWAVVAAACSGAMIVGGDLSVGSFGATQVLPAAAGAVLISVLSLVLLTTGVPGFVAVTGAGLLGVAGAVASDVFGLDVEATAAFAAGLALIVSPAIPVAAFKLSRLQLPFVPTGSGDLRADTTKIDGNKVLNQAARADQFMTGIVVALATVLAGAAVLLAHGGTSSRILAGVIAGICLLRARLFTGRSQRTAMLLAAAVSALAALNVMVAGADSTLRMVAVVLPVGLLALVMLALSLVLPGRRYAPPSGRAADVIESLLVLSVLPLILGTIGVYEEIRDLVG